MYELFEHTADMGLRVRADDESTLFADAARALFSAIVANLKDVRLVEERHVEIDGNDRDYLLFDWLNELLYLFDAERLLLAEFDVHVAPSGLKAVVRGELVDLERHQLEHEVKAITYHGLKVEHKETGWLAEVIVDI
jgi:SHS2 domain-containing protein